jgi:hypothetical protein
MATTSPSAHRNNEGKNIAITKGKYRSDKEYPMTKGEITMPKIIFKETSYDKLVLFVLFDGLPIIFIEVRQWQL